MALFQKKIGPVFLKEESDAAEFIAKMQQFSERVTDEKIKKELQKQIKLASYGEAGEQNIAFELRNSGMDMYILHDIFLEFGDLTAQIDYIIITRKLVFIPECKNLIGNIEIDHIGNFIRSYELFGKKIKEGIYSPITQNQRHMNVLKEVRKTAKSNMITKAFFEKNFNNAYKSVVVLSNPKTYLNARYAKKEVKDQVIRADQLINYIKQTNAACDDLNYSNEQMLNLANFFLEKNQPKKSDYARKYEEMIQELEEHRPNAPREPQQAKEESASVQASVEETKVLEEASAEKRCPRCGNKLVLRISKKGEHAGNQFYGCSNFPKCRYLENIK